MRDLAGTRELRPGRENGPRPFRLRGPSRYGTRCGYRPDRQDSTAARARRFSSRLPEQTIRVRGRGIGACDMDVDREARRQVNVLKARAVDLLVEEE